MNDDLAREFAVGDYVEKFTGEARWFGTVVSRYKTLRGSERYVVEVLPQGFQMIAVPSQLRRATPEGATPAEDGQTRNSTPEQQAKAIATARQMDRDEAQAGDDAGLIARLLAARAHADSGNDWNAMNDAVNRLRDDHTSTPEQQEASDGS